MMSKRDWRQTGCAAVLLALTAVLPELAAAAGHTDAATDSEAPPEYQVELLLFRNNDTARNTPEEPRTPPPSLDNLLDERLAMLESAADAPVFTDRAEPEPAAPVWSAVPDGQRKLAGAADRLQRLGAYQVIAHLAWLQPAGDLTEADELDLSELADLREQAHGTVKFYKKRYLHLALDVRLGSAQAASSGTLMQFANPVTATQPAINDSRRIRPGRLTYFDQPEFGVIALITPVETAEDS